MMRSFLFLFISLVAAQVQHLFDFGHPVSPVATGYTESNPRLDGNSYPRTATAFDGEVTITMTVEGSRYRTGVGAVIPSPQTQLTQPIADALLPDFVYVDVDSGEPGLRAVVTGLPAGTWTFTAYSWDPIINVPTSQNYIVTDAINSAVNMATGLVVGINSPAAVRENYAGTSFVVTSNGNPITILITPAVSFRLRLNGLQITSTIASGNE